jgi:hypothetical protein
VSDPHHPRDADDADDAALSELLDRHPRLRSDAGFARRVRMAAEREAAGSAPESAPSHGPSRLTFVLVVAAAAAFLLFTFLSRIRGGSRATGTGMDAEQTLAARLETPPAEVLRELELLRDLDLLIGDGASGDLAVLLDLGDLELLDRTRALWEDDAEGGD